MKFPPKIVLATLLALAASEVLATKVYECIDEEGNHSFRDYCPPGSTPVMEKRIPTGDDALRERHQDEPTPNDLAEKYPVTLYRVPDCDACDLVRNYLNKRGIPFTEKNAAEDIGVQQELKDKIGSLSVPALIIGEDSVVMGYHPTRLKEAFDAIGYPDVPSTANPTENTAGQN
ncbi:MAG: glutaredoxin family protein [Gammaproteobacteria bacterium]|nr:glutaredoxin family protein [Gammaproteobacteria bacterium]MCI0591751.1 glutaredoxin family protein [Gammaproteobacteria bacterium]